MINPTPFLTLNEQIDDEKLERMKNAENKLTFGISFLDDALIGIFKNDLVLVAGRSGGGKSEMAFHIALMNAIRGRRVYHLALEAEPKEGARRMLYKTMARMYYAERQCGIERPSYIRWYAGLQEDLFEPFYDRAASELKAYDNLKMFYRGSDFGMKELNQIFMSIKGKADLLVLDHLHYVDFPDDNENRAHKDAVKEIRNLALLHSIPVVLVAHIRKGDRRNPSPVPDMEDIHGSSDIFKIATKAIMLAPARDQSVTEQTKSYRFPTYLRVAKCRQDGSLNWFVGLTSFDISKGEYDEQYVLGEFNYAGEFSPLNQTPFWAKRAK